MESDSHPEPTKFDHDHDTVPYLGPTASTDDMRPAFPHPVAATVRSDGTLPLSHNSHLGLGNSPITSTLKYALTPPRYYRWNHASEHIFLAGTWNQPYSAGCS